MASDPLSGYPGHLTGAQEEALVEFKLLCATHGLYTLEFIDEKGVKKASHEDALLL